MKQITNKSALIEKCGLYCGVCGKYLNENAVITTTLAIRSLSGELSRLAGDQEFFLPKPLLRQLADSSTGILKVDKWH